MKVILSANVAHYLYTAQALEWAGYLERYICAVALQKGFHIPSLLPAFWRKKLEGRRIKGISPHKVVSIWLSELLQNGLPRIDLLSPERADWLNNHLYDWMATRYIKECDVFHFVSSVGLYCACLAKAQGAIVICDVRQEHPEFQKRVLTEENRRLGSTGGIPGISYESKVKAEFSLADFFIVPSLYAKATFIEEGIDPDKIFVVPYGFDPDQFKPLCKNDDVFRILFVGAITPRKGVHYLVNAFSKLHLPEAELELIGQCDPSMQRLVINRENKNFRYITNVPKTELFKYYSNASVLVLPSIADAQPLVVLEAMACGIPVIITANCGSKDFVRDGIDGFVIPARDVEALRERLLALYKNKSMRKEMGYQARKRAHEFTWQHYGRRIIEVYHEIANRSGLQV